MSRNTVMGPGDYQRDEYQVGATDVEPGHLVEVSSGEVVPHSTANGAALSTFAIEDQDVGKTPDDTYVAADDENVHIAYPTRGTKVNLAWLAAGENVTEGTLLTSAGDGTLEAYVAADADSGAVVAEAAEAVDNSGGGSAVRIEVKSA